MAATNEHCIFGDIEAISNDELLMKYPRDVLCAFLPQPNRARCQSCVPIKSRIRLFARHLVPENVCDFFTITVVD